MKGEVVYLYAFDVAHEIRTAEVQEILKTKPMPFEFRPHHNFPRDLPFYRPLAIEPPAPEVARNGENVRLLVRVYAIGVVTVAMRVAFETESFDDLQAYHRPGLRDGRSFDQFARQLAADTCLSLESVLVRPSPLGDPEAYTVFCLTDLGGPRDVQAWLSEQGRAVAGLLSEAEASRLSDAQVAEVLRVQRSFAQTDLVLIDWDAAIVVDLSGYVDDVLYVIELANLQLEEFRVMDQTLDGYLDRAYEDVGGRRIAFFGASTPILRKLRSFRVDLTKLADEVTHITKFFGDWYLARVYLGLAERFHLDSWRRSVEARLEQLDDLYRMVHAEVNEVRMLWLEVIIVVLFVIDVVAMFLWKQ